MIDTDRLTLLFLLNIIGIFEMGVETMYNNYLQKSTFVYLLCTIVVTKISKIVSLNDLKGSQKIYNLVHMPIISFLNPFCAYQHSCINIWLTEFDYKHNTKGNGDGILKINNYP